MLIFEALGLLKIDTYASAKLYKIGDYLLVAEILTDIQNKRSVKVERKLGPLGHAEVSAQHRRKECVSASSVAEDVASLKRDLP